MPKHIWTALVAGLILAAQPAAAQDGVGGGIDVEEVTVFKDGRVNIYAAKFVCGTTSPEAGSPNLQLPDPLQTFAFVPGTYLTGVNVLNLNSKRVKVVKFVTPTPPEFFVANPPSQAIEDLFGPNPEVVETLKPFFGFEVDCRDIVGVNALGIPALFDPLGTVVPQLELDDDFISGFVIIRSKDTLKVTAVYTYKTTAPEPP